MTISDQIQAQANESAKALRAQGWEGGGHSYDIGTYHGDAEALAERLGRPTTRDERVSLEHQIRTRLDAAMVDHTPLVIVGLKGGDSSEAKAAVCVDLDRGLVTNGEEWAALVRADRVHDLVEQTGATLVRGPETWDGSRFGDGNGGTVERVDGEVKGSGLYRPALDA